MQETPQVLVAQGFWQRLRGLMLTPSLPDHQALLIPRCASVHTLGMRFALDLVYLDRQGTVIKLVPGLKPWRLSWGGPTARHTLEMSAGGIARYGIRLGSTSLMRAEQLGAAT